MPQRSRIFAATARRLNADRRSKDKVIPALSNRQAVSRELARQHCVIKDVRKTRASLQIAPIRDNKKRSAPRPD